MRNRSGVFAAIFLASCKDLFSIICIYFSLGERPEKKPRYLLCGLIICRPRKAIFGEKPDSFPSQTEWRGELVSQPLMP